MNRIAGVAAGLITYLAALALGAPMWLVLILVVVVVCTMSLLFSIK